MEDFYFTIFNTMWVVSFVDSIKSDDIKEGDFRFGDTNYVNNKITVAIRDHNGDLLPQTTIKLTTLHEIMHAIMGTGQYNTYSDDEPFVEWMANCIYSLLEQKKL